LFPLFATGVNDTDGKFAAGVIDTGGNLPPVSTTQGELGAKLVVKLLSGAWGKVNHGKNLKQKMSL
jgi:hypothetical protein